MRLSKFYFNQTKEFFFKAVMAVVLLNVGGWAIRYFYDGDGEFFRQSSHSFDELTTRVSPLPLLVVIFCSIVILWTINRMDTSDDTRTPASFLEAMEYHKLLSRFWVSYSEVAILVIIEGLFIVAYGQVSIDLVQVSFFFLLLACYCMAFIAYFILLKWIIKGVSLNHRLMIGGYGAALFLIFIGNGFSRYYFSAIDQLSFLNNSHVFLSTFLFNFGVSAGIIWLYLWKNDTGKKRAMESRR